VKKSTPAPLLFGKFIKTPAEVHSYTPASVHHWPLWHWLFPGFSSRKVALGQMSEIRILFIIYPS